MSFSYFLHRIIIFCLLNCITSIIHAQNIYELRKLSEDDWLSMSTEDRLNSLGKANKHAQNQTFLGDFGKHYDHDPPAKYNRRRFAERMDVQRTSFF